MLLDIVIAAVVTVQAQEPRQDTLRLAPIIVRESAKRAHRYSANSTTAATRTSTPLRDAPQSVSVITGGLIREQSMQSLADVIRFVPGATMGQGEGHRDAPTIRGNSSTADFFVDGVRDDAQYVRDLYNVERVEALAGSNAMTFGRGGGGGVINRVTKRAQWNPTHDVTLEGGSFQHRRGSLDVGGPLTHALALRLNGLYQNSGGFRDAFTLRRAGVSPSAALTVGDRTLVRLDGEYFEDRRRVDRGLPSFAGRPSVAPLAVFFGNPDSSYASARVGAASATVERQAHDRVRVQAHVRATSYDKFYQNVLPGAVTTDGSQVSLSAYNADMQRFNLFGQTELVLDLSSSRLPQTLLIGVELGRQNTDNVRRSGFFNGTAATLSVPFGTPTVSVPVEFRPAGTDANSNTVANIGSFYAQSQLRAGAKAQAIFGVRVERFSLDFRDFRSGLALSRTDVVVSPRIGVIYRPAAPLSLYANYSVSHLPSAGDQFASLTVTTQTLEPERFANREVGAKWEPRQDLAITAAVYELARTNTAAPSALDPGVYVQTGSQETRGLEMVVAGRVTSRWDLVGTFAAQRAQIVSATTASPAGRDVPLVPRNTVSLWNRYQASRSIGLAVGAIGQRPMFAAIDNTVTLPGFWRYDAAVFVTRLRAVAFQANVENLFDTRYFGTSHGNNNIMPGAPRTLRLSATARLR